MNEVNSLHKSYLKFAGGARQTAGTQAVGNLAFGCLLGSPQQALAEVQELPVRAVGRVLYPAESRPQPAVQVFRSFGDCTAQSGEVEVALLGELNDNIRTSGDIVTPAALHAVTDLLRLDLKVENEPPSSAAYNPEVDASALAGQERLRELRERLQGYADLPADWSRFGSAPPAALSIARARAALDAMEAVGLTPSEMLPTPEESIGITFRMPNLYADLEFYSDGEVLAATHDRRSDAEPVIWSLAGDAASIHQALVRIHEFFLNP